jgi:hypothetical protein
VTILEDRLADAAEDLAQAVALAAGEDWRELVPALESLFTSERLFVEARLSQLVAAPTVLEPSQFEPARAAPEPVVQPGRPRRPLPAVAPRRQRVTTVPAAMPVSRRERWGLFVVWSIVYAVLGAVLAFGYDSFNADEQSRLANGFYMLYSRDPHLAAVGFVWNPLSSWADLPLLLLRHLWPALSTREYTANVMSALFMAGSLAVVACMLGELGVRRRLRWVLTFLYAANPMILYYGANGMSEAIFLFTLALTAYYLTAWVRDGRLRSLVFSGSALGLAYLARNEAVFAAAFGGLLVVAVSFGRSWGSSRRRLMDAATDGMIFSAPFIVSFVGWAVTSWIIVGHPFEQYSSIYGTASQLRLLNQSGALIVNGSPARLVVREITALAPLLPILFAVAAIAVARRRDYRVLAPAGVFGGVFIFAVGAYLKGQTAGWFRYYISEVPLAIVLAATVAVALDSGASSLKWAPQLRHIGSVLLVLAVAPAMVTSYQAMMSRTVGREESLLLRTVVPGVSSDARERTQQARQVAIMSMAAKLDALRLPRGSIVTDTATPCVPPLVLASGHPQQFVITNDRDFQRVLDDPVTFRARFLLVPEGSGYGSLDAVVRTYPSLYQDGAGFAHLYEQFQPSACPNFRLLEVDALTPRGSK